MPRRTKQQEIDDLKTQLAEAEETLRAIRSGEVDALIVTKPEGQQQIYTLEGAEKPHRLLVEAMNEGAMTLNAAGTVLYSNARLAEMAKKPLEHIIGSSWRQLFPENEQSSFEFLLERAHESGVQGELSLISTVGKCLPVQVSVSTMKLLGTDVFAILLTDISTVKTAEEALRQVNEKLEIRVQERTAELRRQNEFLEKLIGNASIGVAVVDRNLRYLVANPSYQAIPGTLGTGMVGRTIAQVFPSPVAKVVQAYVQKVFQTGAPLNIREYDIEIDGQRTYWNVSEVPLRDAAGEVEAVLILTQEMTERKRSEEALAEAQKKLQQHAHQLEQTVQERTAKLQEMVADLEHFSYTITHDMRAPLRAMRGFGHMLIEECADCIHAQRRELLSRIAASAGRMDSLIVDALNFTKVVRQELHLSPINPGPLLKDIVESYPQFQRPKAEIAIEGDFPVVLANEAGLTQCFSNLLGNAVKFVHPDQVPKVRIWTEPRGAYVRFWFEDNGIGIAPEHQDQIWVMFQRLNTSYEGTGIGLALVRKIAQRMKGRVGVESEEGKGSRFWVELERCT